MARAVRLGYNVLSTDNDVVMFDDFYSYFKSPPFNSFTVINQEEWPDTRTASMYFHDSHCNLFIFYCVSIDIPRWGLHLYPECSAQWPFGVDLPRGNRPPAEIRCGRLGVDELPWFVQGVQYG